MTIFWIIFFSALGSVGSVLAAYIPLAIQKETHGKKLHYLVAYAQGTLLTSAIIGLLPHAIHHAEELFPGEPAMLVMTWLLIGIIIFIIIEKLITWHHCHDVTCETHKALGSMVLIGDALHNLVDGVVIAASFLLSFEIGIVVSIPIIVHEIAQELGDFALLLNSGYPRKKALIFNLLSSTSTIIAAIIAYFALEAFEIAIPFIIAISAGSFLYIAISSGASLSAEFHGKKDRRKTVPQIFFMLIGVVTIIILLQFHVH
ncbi:MAG: ZIP family metal transporter [Candidatus Hodarchaeota archaeon]